MKEKKYNTPSNEAITRGLRLRTIRETMGYKNQTDFAAFLGYKSKSNISRWENGNPIPPEDVTKIINITGINPDYLKKPSEDVPMFILHPVPEKNRRDTLLLEFLQACGYEFSFYATDLHSGKTEFYDCSCFTSEKSAIDLSFPHAIAYKDNVIKHTLIRWVDITFGNKTETMNYDNFSVIAFMIYQQIIPILSPDRINEISERYLICNAASNIFLKFPDYIPRGKLHEEFDNAYRNQAKMLTLINSGEYKKPLPKNKEK